MISTLAARRKSNGMSRRNRRQFFANDFSALNPTIWANEAITQLLPNMVIANLISRDFDNKVAKFGDLVNAFIPSTFQMTRKGALCENVVVQDASGSFIQVPLDQWPQVSFLICDGEEDRNTLDLIDTLLTPAVIALAQGIDRIIGGQVYQFLENRSGHAGGMDEDSVKSYVLEARENMNRRNVPLVGRTLILTPGSETDALSVESFTDASFIGDQGQALREAALGRKYGFDIFMAQTQPEVSTGQATLGVLAVDNASGYPANTSTIAFDGAAAASVDAGQWALIAGDDTPLHITANTSNSMTFEFPTKRAVANNAAIVIVTPGAVNKVGGYAGTTTSPRVIGHNKEILVDAFPDSAPQVGQLVTFAEQTERYTIIRLRIIDASAGTFGIELNRPLTTAILDDATVNLGPAANYNFAFLRNAFALVTRPLPQPRAGTGAISRVIVDPINKLSIRVTITYDGEKQGHLVTLDLLIGTGVLSSDLGEVLLG